MGVSCVTITIEEFERLIEKEKKLDKIMDAHSAIMREIRETNKLAIEKLLAGDKKGFDEAIDKQTLRDVEFIGKINNILGDLE